MATNTAKFVKRVRFSNTGSGKAWDPDEESCDCGDTGGSSDKRKLVNIVVGGSVSTGIQLPIIRLPFNCKVNGVYAVASYVSTEDTVIQVERCTQSDVIASPVWSAILSQPITIDAEEYSSASSTISASIGTNTLNINDHVRINVISTGINMRGLTVELDVEVI